MKTGTKVLLIGSGMAVAALAAYLVYQKTNSADQPDQSAPNTDAQNAQQVPTVSSGPVLLPQSAPDVTMADLQKLDWYNQAGVHISPLSKYLKDYNPVTKVATHTDPSWTGKLVASNKIAWTRNDGLQDSWTGVQLSGISGVGMISNLR